MFNGKTILITGGTGSFGKNCVRMLLSKYNPHSIRIFSRDELKQWEMQKSYASHPKRKLLRFFIGDIRNKQRIKRASENCDIIIHAAALKQVPACEYNPIEAIQTNIDGAINVIDAALDNNVKKVIALSTDKASQPINLYGATKLCSDKLFIQANNYRGYRQTAFSVVRYGNVMGSRGSVIPLFIEQAKSGKITVTHEEMTRFWITLDQAVEFVLSCFKIMQGGELFVPKIPSMKLIDLAKAIAPEAKIKVIGIRPGEKLHESLIGPDEALNTYEAKDFYLIKPQFLELWQDKKTKVKIKKVPKKFDYNSLDNTNYLSVKDIEKFVSQL